MPDRVLKRSRAEVVLLRRSTEQFVLDLLDATDIPAGRFADERASPLQLVDQVPRDVAKLGGEVLMNIHDMHGAA
jgi:hypothetical protein